MGREKVEVVRVWVWVRVRGTDKTEPSSVAVWRLLSDAGHK